VIIVLWPQVKPIWRWLLLAALAIDVLGAGTLATYGRQGDEMRLYEIDDQVLDLARSDFSYLAESRARIELEPADGDVFCRRSLWALMVRPERAASLQAAIAGARLLQPRAGFTAWTDGFSNLLGILN